MSMSEAQIVAALQELTGADDVVAFLDSEGGKSTVSWGC